MSIEKTNIINFLIIQQNTLPAPQGVYWEILIQRFSKPAENDLDVGKLKLNLKVLSLPDSSAICYHTTKSILPF